MQPAARIVLPQAAKRHTCSLSSVFRDVHAAAKNDWNFFAPAGANSVRHEMLSFKEETI